MRISESSFGWLDRVSANWQRRRAAAFNSHAHGLLRDEGLAVRPLDQYWAFGAVAGRLSEPGGPVKASVELPSETIDIGRPVEILLTATNASDRARPVRFRPIGFVGALGLRITPEIETASVVSRILRLTPSPPGWARPRGPLALRLDYGTISVSILTAVLTAFALAAAAAESDTVYESGFHYLVANQPPKGWTWGVQFV